MLSNGHAVEGIYRGEENNSFDVIKNLLEGKQEYEFVPLFGKDEDSQLFIKAGDISAVEIFEKKEEK
jgi:hypothetical protein